MGKIFLLEPEVSGGIGDGTIYRNENEISYLHYEFDGWLGDEIIESTPYFLISEALSNYLRNNGIDDFSIEECLITTSDLFRELYPKKELPKFYRLVPEGKAKILDGKVVETTNHEILLSEKNYLLVSQKTMDILNSYPL